MGDIIQFPVRRSRLKRLSSARRRWRIKVLHFVRDHVDAFGFWPSIVDIQKATGIASENGVRRYIFQLHEDGDIAAPLSHLPKGPF